MNPFNDNYGPYNEVFTQAYEAAARGDFATATKLVSEITQEDSWSDFDRAEEFKAVLQAAEQATYFALIEKGADPASPTSSPYRYPRRLGIEFKHAMALSAV